MLFSCQNDNCSSIKSLRIYEDQISEFDLFEGRYIVHYMAKKDSVVVFPITEIEKRKIKDFYIKNNICSYGTDVLIQEADPLIMPATEFKYIVEFDSGKKQTIRIVTDFNKDPLKRKGNERMKKFIDTINQILNKKSELKNKPKSDIFSI